MQSPINHIFLCCFLVFISLFYTQTYLTSLPHIADSLFTSSSVIQLSFAANILGFGFSQILYGPYSELYGRKKTLLTGLLIALFGNILCASSINSGMLCIGQLISGIGAGACSIIPRIVSKDTFSGTQLLKTISYMSIASTVATGIAPIIGGLLQNFIGWRSIFIFLIILTIIALFLISIFFTEAIKSNDYSISIRKITKYYTEIFIDKDFLIYAVINSLAYSGIIIYLIMSPFLFQKIFSYSASQNSLIYLFCSACYLIGNFIFPYLNKLTHSRNLIGLGLTIIAISCSLIINPQQLTSIKLIGCGMLIHLGSGLLTPITYKKILENIKCSTGTTAGAINSVRVLVAFSVSIFATRLTASSALSLTYVLGVLSLISIGTYSLLINNELEE